METQCGFRWDGEGARACQQLGHHKHKNNKTLTKIIARKEYKNGANGSLLRGKGQKMKLFKVTFPLTSLLSFSIAAIQQKYQQWLQL